MQGGLQERYKIRSRPDAEGLQQTVEDLARMGYRLILVLDEFDRVTRSSTFGEDALSRPPHWSKKGCMDTGALGISPLGGLSVISSKSTMAGVTMLTRAFEFGPPPPEKGEALRCDRKGNVLTACLLDTFTMSLKV